MIKRFIFGMPIETGAILEKPEVLWTGFEDISGFQQTEDGFSYHMENEEIVYGLGETVRGINKRGWSYESYCADDPEHREDKHALYGAHNFFMICGKKHRGYFLDTPGRVIFDIGYTQRDIFQIVLEDFALEVYVIDGETSDEVVTQFRQLIGQSYIPPKWAFGYGQSRWSYMSSDEIREVEEKYQQEDFPLDSIYLDIDYMERYKDFTINETTFGDFDLLVREMRKKKIHLVPIIDAGIKIEEGYEVYEEGKENGYFCKDEEGKDFVIGVWPGRCHFPDMLNADVRKWFGKKYHALLVRGIDGFWNDMNEPAIFYSEKQLDRVFQRIDNLKKEELDINSYFELTGLVAGTSNNLMDHEAFFHHYTIEEKNGKTKEIRVAGSQRENRIRHEKVHNLFGFYMTKAASDAFESLVPEKRILLFSRASYIGMHRYGGIWQGDNMSWWSHLLLNIKMMPSLNMCGFLYTGADIGGFGADTTEELMIRWLSFGIFTPLMRNHSAMGTRRQELYQFSQKDKIRGILKMRYRLLPYLYSEYMKAALRGKMMFRPLSFVFEEDEIAREVEDELLIGDEILIAPVYEQNQSGRFVYLPERMKLLRFQEGEMIEQTVYEKGVSFISMPLGDVCIFLREGRKLFLGDAAKRAEEVNYEKLTMYSFGELCGPYEYYMDDGETKEYSLEKNIRVL